MGMRKPLSKSELEWPNRKSGLMGLRYLWERVRIVYRTGTVDNLDATPDDWKEGGAKSTRDRL